MKLKLLPVTLFLSIYSISSFAQTVDTTATVEEALSLQLLNSPQATVIGGYGEAHYSNNLSAKTATANLDRAVIFLGHKFNNRISFFSELEVEDAKVAGGEPGGEISLEQSFVRFRLQRNAYLYTGLFIPRIGITNENHLPTTFNGCNRPFVETVLLPSTWRELGVGLYGRIPSMNGLQYTLALANGLSSAGFESGSGIREGRFEGRNATAGNLATLGSLTYDINNFRFQASGYAGGSAGLTPRVADSLQLSSGFFGTPVFVYDFNVQYQNGPLYIKALYAGINIPEAEAINKAYANNTAKELYGGYVEVAYNVLSHCKKYNKKQLNAFVRYENLDLNSLPATNGIIDYTLMRQYVVGGISFLPLRGVIIKADVVLSKTGNINPALITNPFPQQQTYLTQQQVFNVGIGYSF